MCPKVIVEYSEAARRAVPKTFTACSFKFPRLLKFLTCPPSPAVIYSSQEPGEPGSKLASQTALHSAG
ncbi:hypothetical protein M441DRAFT_52975 [Trichoderma asperellum CBS 433.97]|uniref:Uncharacterized protein n=1 Tax=Trichoderma asperellum (strain ATCC 204424 / CBS 433.97 / NBRC 101777) TaxID=1042311 RepID=A0A2T3ZN31_TRIA4|nr:hypothetical protein M441DRAFT_52975 [Trichoderma asperellum CBS 433.97]PTB46215.1 hypothetical protein M441DRAFT_52975 [Trichoderma asperellum CBS 433.97]